MQSWLPVLRGIDAGKDSRWREEANATRPKYKGEMLTGTVDTRKDVIGQLDELIALDQQGQRIAKDQHSQQACRPRR